MINGKFIGWIILFEKRGLIFCGIYLKVIKLVVFVKCFYVYCNFKWERERERGFDWFFFYWYVVFFKVLVDVEW